MGGSTVVGDMRWTGTFGVNADLVAKSHCSVELIRTEHILVRDQPMLGFCPAVASEFPLINGQEDDSQPIHHVIYLFRSEKPS